jgi:hypothetical protein
MAVYHVVMHAMSAYRARFRSLSHLAIEVQQLEDK